jgi:hypothetical protein
VRIGDVDATAVTLDVGVLTATFPQIAAGTDGLALMVQNAVVNCDVALVDRT